jgi:hypothetical protein
MSSEREQEARQELLAAILKRDKKVEALAQVVRAPNEAQRKGRENGPPPTAVRSTLCQPSAPSCLQRLSQVPRQGSLRRGQNGAGSSGILTANDSNRRPHWGPSP